MNNFILPLMAYRQLKNAYESGSSVYIYGATGYGKTRLVREFLKEQEAIGGREQIRDQESLSNQNSPLWLSAKDAMWDTSTIGPCVVVDDVQFLNEDSRREMIIDLIRGGRVRVIVIGRMPSPLWLMPWLRRD